MYPDEPLKRCTDAPIPLPRPNMSRIVILQAFRIHLIDFNGYFDTDLNIGFLVFQKITVTLHNLKHPLRLD